MSHKDELDKIEKLINEAVAESDLDFRNMKGREAYCKLRTVHDAAKTLGTWEQHRDRMHGFTCRLLDEIFEIHTAPDGYEYKQGIEEPNG